MLTGHSPSVYASVASVCYLYALHVIVIEMLANSYFGCQGELSGRL